MTNSIVLSTYIFPLTKFGKSGKVHSLFERSFNIQIGNQLVNIANYKEYLASFGLYLPDNQFQAVRPQLEKGNFVKIREDYLSFYTRFGVQTIELKKKQLVSLDVKDLSFTLAELKLLKEVLEALALEKKIGLTMTPQLRELFEKMRHSDNDWQAIIRFLIGRGKGLTPSGDDILLSYHMLLRIVKQISLEKLTEALLAKNLSTTDVSKAYMASSIDGYVNSLIYQLFKDVKSKQKQLIEKDVKMLLGVGHTSGADLSFGMLLALQSMNL
ncbi:DUF2877 domain-containing protein [Enterococcus phoeniculicola]|uniref:DUF2877 domain-containing protein n=1 Tax=Enterococcus phoeniculicola ATCC BAA-412 TaxID=1158610 RepID=R3W305_9ENTE|nr:DUF2877 domain-containing protein [Enterococcus phoeniculicola]EOL41836.1 hypothetical protein UC3_03401 [Enterococcus phoeniculicola ATCC BAA-412]EOT78670.1 hypothetical protein I589_00175 [Enterococcus phoeniculicola ATCC BAA-412]